MTTTERGTTRFPSGTRAALAVLAGVALAACAGEADGEAFWEANRVYADEAEPFLPLPEMMETADAVVLGTFGETEPRREHLNVTYLRIELVIDEVIEGELEEDAVVLEFLAETEPDALPSEQMLVLLRLKDGEPDPADTWRVTNSRGLWTSTARAELDTPLNEDPPAVDPQYADMVEEASNAEELVEIVTR